jgi:hypothetical protein
MGITRPTPPPKPALSSDWGFDDPEPAPAAAPRSARNSFPFKADLDLAEVDERGRPGAPWPGRACELSRSHIAFRSRRMCYEGRAVLVAVHLVDDRPVALFGVVARSEYDGEGLYRTTLDLAALPKSDGVTAWLAGLTAKA